MNCSTINIYKNSLKLYDNSMELYSQINNKTNFYLLI
jgi:hypothetical protein